MHISAVHPCRAWRACCGLFSSRFGIPTHVVGVHLSGIQRIGWSITRKHSCVHEGLLTSCTGIVGIYPQGFHRHRLLSGGLGAKHRQVVFASQFAHPRLPHYANGPVWRDLCSLGRLAAPLPPWSWGDIIVTAPLLHSIGQPLAPACTRSPTVPGLARLRRSLLLLRRYSDTRGWYSS